MGNVEKGPVYRNAHVVRLESGLKAQRLCINMIDEMQFQFPILINKSNDL